MRVDRRRFLASHPEYSGADGELDLMRSCCASAHGLLDSPREDELLKEVRAFVKDVKDAGGDDARLVRALQGWKYGHDPTTGPPELTVSVTDGQLCEYYEGMAPHGRDRFLSLRTGLHAFNLALFADVLDAVDAAIERNVRRGRLIVDACWGVKRRRSENPPKEAKAADESAESTPTQEDAENAADIVQACLRFLTRLLSVCTGFDTSVFNSLAHLVDLLASKDERLVDDTLSVVFALVSNLKMQCGETFAQRSRPIQALAFKREEGLRLCKRLLVLAGGWGKEGEYFRMARCVADDKR